MKKIIEAALFISGRGLSLEELVSTLESNPADVKNAVEELRTDYNSRDTPLEIIEIDGNYKIDVRAEYLEKVKGLAPQMDMGRALLTSLSYIAYKQPISQSVLVKKFGNRIYEYVNELEKRALIRAEPHRRSKMLTTTKKLLTYLGESDLEKLKSSVEAAKIERQLKAELEKEKFTPKLRTRKKTKEILEKELGVDEWMEKIKTQKIKQKEDAMDAHDKSKRVRKEADFEDDMDLIMGKSED